MSDRPWEDFAFIPDEMSDVALRHSVLAARFWAVRVTQLDFWFLSQRLGTQNCGGDAADKIKDRFHESDHKFGLIKIQNFL